jgi:ribose transport system substrate-binding protein
MVVKSLGRCGSYLVIACIVGVLGACGSSDDEAGTEAASTSKEPVALGVFAGGVNGYTKAELEGIQAAARKLEAEVTVSDARFDPATQSAQLQTAIGQDKFDAIIIQALSNQHVVPRIEQAGAKGVKVVCMLTQCGSDFNTLEPQVEGQTGFVGSLAARDGSLLAKLAAEACGDTDPCRVAWMETTPSLPFEAERTNGFKAELAKNPAIELVSVQAGQFAEQPAFAAARNVLAANPDLDVYASATSQMARGILRAVEGGSHKGDIRIVTGGGTEHAVQAVKDGRYYSTTVSMPFTEGELAATMAIKAARGEQTETGIDFLSKSPVGPFLTRENADKFEPQWRE